VKTCNTGAGTTEDPKCVTVWAPGGEDLNTKYGAGNANEIVDGRPMVKTGTVGGCARCGGGVALAHSPQVTSRHISILRMGNKITCPDRAASVPGK
jgi:uncharacterized Zn-binding protein involved in type VI secretion